MDLIARAPFILSLLTSLLLAGTVVFVLFRRPRQPVTWCFVGVMAGLIVFYLSDVILYRPGTLVRGRLRPLA